MNQDIFSASREEVVWYFAASDATMGLHGQYIGGGGGSGVWDEAASMRAHAAQRSLNHQWQVQRRARVHDTMMRMPRPAFEDLRAVYNPFGAARASWQAHCVFTKGKRRLLGLALRTFAAPKIFERRLGDERAHREQDGRLRLEIPFHELLAWIEDEVARLDRNSLDRKKAIKPGHALPQGHCLNAVLKEASEREESAIAQYDDLRRRRIEDRRQENAERLESYLAAKRERESAKFDAKLARRKRENDLARERAVLWAGTS